LKSCLGAKFCLSSFFFPILGGSGCFERGKKASGSGGYFIYGSFERNFVGLGWLVKTANLSNELKGSVADFFWSDWRFEIKKILDISAHNLCTSILSS